MIRNWDGLCGITGSLKEGDGVRTKSLGMRNFVSVWLDGKTIMGGEAPQLLDAWMFRIIDVEKDQVLKELPLPEICQLTAEAGYPPETVEGYYKVEGEGKYLLAEFRVPDKKRIRRRTEYYNRQVVIIDLVEGKTLFSRFFQTADGFLGTISPRFFPLYTFTVRRGELVSLLSGPVNQPALYFNDYRDPIALDSFDGETRFRFLGESLLFQWDHYRKRCRFFSVPEGKFLGEYKRGIRFPVFDEPGFRLASLQDDGYHLYHWEKGLLKGGEFYPFTAILYGCRFGYFLADRLLLFPSRFDNGVILWEDILLGMESL